MGKVVRKSNKKAVLFTFTLLIMSIILFSTSIIFKSMEEKNSERVVYISLLDRVYDLSESISSGIVEIIQQEKLFDVIADGNKITFTETLGENTSNNFKTILEGYKEFVGNDKNIELNISEIVDNLDTIVIPQNIVYSHNSSLNDTILISQGAVNYSITITTPRNIQNCIWNTVGGSFNVRVKVIDPNGVACDESNSIDENEDNRIHIQGNRYEILINNGGVLEIVNNKANQEEINVVIEAGLDNIIEDVVIGDIIVDPVISIEFRDFNISLERGISLLRN